MLKIFVIICLQTLIWHLSLTYELTPVLVTSGFSVKLIVVFCDVICFKILTKSLRLFSLVTFHWLQNQVLIYCDAFTIFFRGASSDVFVIHWVVSASNLANWSSWSTSFNIIARNSLPRRFQKVFLKRTGAINIVNVQCVPYELVFFLEFTLVGPLMRVVYVDSCSLDLFSTSTCCRILI